MRLLILFIAILISQVADSQIISASPPYRVRASGVCNYPLDTYTGAKSGLSLRKIDNDYAGSAVRIRRSSDNTESDIGFTGCNLNESALTAFVGVGDGFVTTVYDQTGAGNNGTQSVAANQPRLVSSGVVDKLNGKPAMYFDGNDFLNINSVTAEAVLDMYFVSSSSDTKYVYVYSTDGGVVYAFPPESGSTSTALHQSAGTPSLYQNGSLFSGTTRGDLYTAVNGTKVITIQSLNTTFATNWGGLFKVFGYSASSYGMVGYCPEIIFWDSDQSANRAGIVAAINSFYSIY